MPENQEAKAKDKARREFNQHIENLPDILTAQHIADYLGISRRRVYELFQIKPEFGGIKNFDIGTSKSCSKRAKKTDFSNWLNSKVEEKTEKTNLTVLQGGKNIHAG